jgi:hypothetical protein
MHRLSCRHGLTRSVRSPVRPGGSRPPTAPADHSVPPSPTAEHIRGRTLSTTLPESYVRRQSGAPRPSGSSTSVDDNNDPSGAPATDGPGQPLLTGHDAVVHRAMRTDGSSRSLCPVWTPRLERAAVARAERAAEFSHWAHLRLVHTTETALCRARHSRSLLLALSRASMQPGSTFVAINESPAPRPERVRLLGPTRATGTASSSMRYGVASRRISIRQAGRAARRGSRRPGYRARSWRRVTPTACLPLLR